MPVKIQNVLSATDSNLSFAAPEFVWNAAECSEAHYYLAPVTLDFLSYFGSRTVLDLGCGNGAFTNVLQAGGYDVTGCDLSASGIALAKEKFTNITFFQQDLTQQLSRNHTEQYDAVVSTEVIEHLLLPRSLVSNAVVAMRPGGVFIVSTPFHGYWKNLALAVSNKFDDHWHPLRDFGHVKFFSRNTLSRLLREYGLQIQRIKVVGRVPIFGRSIVIAACKSK
jgi:2-polyprenyl-3-methyl-5-hydroxy-6-metoxy-1,4-benzoquinol methylase